MLFLLLLFHILASRVRLELFELLRLCLREIEKIGGDSQHGEDGKCGHAFSETNAAAVAHIAHERADALVAALRIDFGRAAADAREVAVIIGAEELLHCHAERVDVAPGVGRAVAVLLGRRVAARAEVNGVGGLFLALRPHDARRIKINQADRAVTLFDEVFRLDVAVEDAVRMEHGKAVCKREQTAPRLAFRQVVLCLDAPRKRLTLHAFFEDVRLARLRVFEKSVDFRPERMRECFELRERQARAANALVDDGPSRAVGAEPDLAARRLAQTADFLEQPEEIALCLVHATTSLLLVLSYSL